MNKDVGIGMTSNSFSKDVLKNIVYLALTFLAIWVGGTGLDIFVEHYQLNSTFVWLAFGISAVFLAIAEALFNNQLKWQAYLLIVISAMSPLIAIIYGAGACMSTMSMIQFILIYFPINMGGFGLLRTIGEINLHNKT